MKEPRNNSTKTLSKNFSTKMRNIDLNTYRAFKLVNETVKKNPYEILKSEHNSNKFPFGLKEERFRWQNTKNLGEKTELKGTMVRRSSVDSNPDWESFMQRTATLPNKSNITNKSQAYKYELNRNTKRTINPQLDHSADATSDRIYKKENKSRAIGSIQNLLLTTPGVETKHKKYSERLLQGSEIFTPSEPNLKMRIKIPVDLNKIKNSNDYAGNNRVDKPVTKGPRSNSQVMKLQHLQSEIFSKPNKDKVKRVKNYEYLNTTNNYSNKKDVHRSGPEIFNSSIIF